MEAIGANNATFTESDVVNIDAWIPADDTYNPHRVRPWHIGDALGTRAVVFASNMRDALDEAIDAGKLDTLQIADCDGGGDDGCDCLVGGNASEHFDHSYLWCEEIPNPTRPFTLCYFQHVANDRPPAPEGTIRLEPSWEGFVVPLIEKMLNMDLHDDDGSVVRNIMGHIRQMAQLADKWKDQS